MTITTDPVPVHLPSVVSEWRSGWPIVGTGIVGNAFSSLAAISLGAFVAPLAETFGWTRTALSAGLAAYCIEGALCFSLVGALLDRWGAKPVAIPGALLSGIVFGLFATLEGSLVGWLLLWLLLGLVNPLITVTVWSSAVSRAFSRSRGLALTLTLTGNGIGAFAAPVLASWLIDREGWT